MFRPAEFVQIRVGGHTSNVSVGLHAGEQGELMLKIQGLDKLRRQLDGLSRKAGAINGTNSVQLDPMLTPAFVVRHTGVSDVDTFFSAGGFSVKSRADLDAIPEAQLDERVQRNSKFGG